MDTCSQIISYEQGELDASSTLCLFAELLRTGLAWKLQGHYGRTAASLIEGGYLSREGDILRQLKDA